MKKIAIYGKGGIGKSTITSNLSAAIATIGKSVIQIGCDPKADSTINLLGGVPPKTILSYIEENGMPKKIEEIAKTGFANTVTFEVGGPTPGQGCAGRGIVTALELLKELNAYEIYKPEVVFYDVLGDVVCGGFAVPMRKGYAEKVIVVTSGEKLSLFAAENIIKAVRNFKNKGYASLLGIIVNLRNIPNELEKVQNFAKEMNVDILGVLPRDESINKAELLGKTVIEYDKNAQISKNFYSIAKRILDAY
jgi:nitrogenase iron protein NifH